MSILIQSNLPPCLPNVLECGASSAAPLFHGVTCCEGGFTVDGQTVKDALCLQCRRAGYECKTAKSHEE